MHVARLFRALCARHVDFHVRSHFGSRLLCVCSLCFCPEYDVKLLFVVWELISSSLVLSYLLASGGFCADLTQNSLWATCRPDLLTVSTALVTRSKWVKFNTHRSRVGPEAFHRLGEAGRPPMPKSSSSQQKRSRISCSCL